MWALPITIIILYLIHDRDVSWFSCGISFNSGGSKITMVSLRDWQKKTPSKILPTNLGSYDCIMKMYYLYIEILYIAITT